MTISIDRFIGVDPGKTGAIAAFDFVGGRRTLAYLYEMPNTGHDQFDRAALIKLCREIVAGKTCYAIVEKIQSFGKDKQRRGLEKLAGNAQQWAATLETLGARVNQVAPRKWQKSAIGSFFLGQPKSVRFAEIRRQAKLLFPTAAIELVKHTDRAAAIMLADYGMREARILLATGKLT